MRPAFVLLLCIVAGCRAGDIWLVEGPNGPAPSEGDGPATLDAGTTPPPPASDTGARAGADATPVSDRDGGRAPPIGADGGASYDASAPASTDFVETFTNGAPDNAGWMLGDGWSVDGAADRSMASGGGALVGTIANDAAVPVYERATIRVPLGDTPKLTFHRRVDFTTDGAILAAAFRVKVDGATVDEVRTLSSPLSEPWSEHADIDLGAHANQEVELTFEVTAASYSWRAAATAQAIIDDIRITGSVTTPPPPPPPPPPTRDGGTAPPPPPIPNGAAYANASESTSDLVTALDITGHFGVSLAGGHLIASDARGGTSLPRETPVSSSGTVDIPAGATVRHAMLWYTGIIFLKPHNGGEGDYTPDRGGTLDDLADVQANGITFELGGQSFGPFDTTSRLVPDPSSLGHESVISPRDYAPSFGTLTGAKESVYGNRLDVTGLLQGMSGAVSVTVNPPERMDINGNDAGRNGGNPAGNTTHNLCTSGASWSLMVIYEKADLPNKNLVLMDGPWARAWDYIFFHSGVWQRPKVRIDHAPIQPGAKLYVYAGSSSEVGHVLPSNPACSCGCGGAYTLKNRSGPYGRSDYFSDRHEDPVAARSDPLSRDRHNGPWYLHSTGLTGIAGNDWTLFQSGGLFTEFPNLYEGAAAPSADETQPVTNEDDPDSNNDVYAGHPWRGRGEVRYHGTGNASTTVEIALANGRVTPGETTSYVYLKGDQKDVWKPQQIVSVKYMMLETPVP